MHCVLHDTEDSTRHYNFIIFQSHRNLCAIHWATFLPKSIFIWESQRVQESSIQKHELVIDPSNLKRPEEKDMVKQRGLVFISVWLYCTVCNVCTYVSFARSGLWITFSKLETAARKLVTACLRGSEMRYSWLLSPSDDCILLFSLITLDYWGRT